MTADLYGPQTLAFGSFRTGQLPGPRVGVRMGERVLDVTGAADRFAPEHASLFRGGNLDDLLQAGPTMWEEVRRRIVDALTDQATSSAIEPSLIPLSDVQLELPFTVSDYVDFYASEHHAANLGRLFRPGQPPLPANWKSLPMGYHGRAGTVVPSGTPIIRPRGLRRESADGPALFGPSLRLDVEVELGFVVGVPSALGTSVPLNRFADHVFGVCVVNDWSARDIQAFEYVPLGPFLGKSFATSISPWIIPLASLQSARVPPPTRDPTPSPYLDDSSAEPWGLDITFELALNGHVVSRPNFGSMYWTGAQQLAHLTANGASLRTGDLFASGTVSGPRREEVGSLIELTENGRAPLTLGDGSKRCFLHDGDAVEITATAPGPDGATVGLGSVAGAIRPSPR